MGLMNKWIHYGKHEQYSGYFAVPEQAQKPLPAVIVFQEVWGVDEHIQDVTRRFAQAGYAAMAPDLYSESGERKPGLEPSRIDAVKSFLETMPPTAWHSEEERNKALQQLPGDEPQRVGETFGKLFGGLSPDNYTEQVLAAAQFLREENESTQGQGIVSVGFCMGGALSAHLAAHDRNLKGAVMFYGRPPKDELIQNINCPVRAFYGELDERLTKGAPAFSQQMTQHNKDFEYTVYEQAHHAFFNDSRRSYNVKASRSAFAKTLGWFSSWIG
ncbi:dienelactone hydrolase family protein [Alicyclobacillus sp. SO9]|uniref:dienelactone hydrolase family protein n=1 Tax=Alicyclobacillus sp. SO9 TaxID=2665646 RepID=UPI0018E89BDE|nr:dienelactone hydrolase family protein [Alicyclobacillus sp. SO9]QQE79313.1 dienelactone hydrolase family protein [Alicyclobacillus sp. SO9]